MNEHGSAHALAWHTSVWPMILSVGILFLVPLSFAFYFVYKMPMAAIISLGIGTPLTLISIAGWVNEGIKDEHHYSEGHVIWAMPIFILAEAMLFIAFFAAYWALRLSQPSWPPAGTPEMPVLVPIIMTIVLVTSSLTIHLGEKRLEEGDTGGFIKWLVVTIILGVLFMGFTGLEWSKLVHEGFTIKTNIFSTSFYSLTGFHASHVLVGVALFICALLPALGGKVSKPFVTAASMYWHFVDIIWFFVASQVYFW